LKVSEFLSLEGDFKIAAGDVQKLNRNLSELSASDVPKEKSEHVLDYLIAALNAGSVDPSFLIKIEKLTSDLQENR
jgi:hypothetical protein